jgi:pimeloyl-ACP methyl ester carboxylesterase
VDAVSATATPRTISSLNEQPAFFDAGGETLFGLLTRPAGGQRDSALLMVPSAERLGYRSRVGAMLAHRLAEAGHQAFRFSYRGCGESTGTAGRFRLAELLTDDVAGAVSWLGERGIGRVYYSGSCFGARTALAAAEGEPAAAGLVLVSMPLTNFAPGEYGRLAAAGASPRTSVTKEALSARRLLDLRKKEGRAFYATAIRGKIKRIRRGSAVTDEEKNQVSKQMLRSLTKLLDRGVRILFIYGDADGAYQEYLEASKGPFGSLIRKAGDRVEVRVIPGLLHGWVSLTAGEAAVSLMTEWVSRVDRPELAA